MPGISDLGDSLSNAVLCRETCPVTVKALSRTGPVGTSWFFTSSSSSSLTREELKLPHIFVLGSINPRYGRLHSVSTCCTPQDYPEMAKDSTGLISLIKQFLEYIKKYVDANPCVTPIIMILGHGGPLGDSDLNIQLGVRGFPVIKSSIISDFIKELQFKECYGLIETCFSGLFDTSCFTGALTAANSEQEANHGILQQSIDFLSGSTFTFNKIHEMATSELSPIVINRMAWSDDRDVQDRFTSQKRGRTDIEFMSVPKILENLTPIVKDLKEGKLNGKGGKGFTTPEYTDELNKRHPELSYTVDNVNYILSHHLKKVYLSI